jgi:cobalt-zinc-cadmium efflux system protein
VSRTHSHSRRHDHDHHHDHHHHHDHLHHGASSRNIAIAFMLNASFAVIELVGGWWTNSVAIQADAIHDFGDSLMLASALVLQSLSHAGARGRFNFGFRRLSLLSALATSTILLVGSIFIVTRAVSRLWEPSTPHLDGMLGLAVLGVLVNGIAAYRMSHGVTQNERSLSWHMIEDLLGWIAVLISALVMRFIEVPWLDPVLSLLIAGVVLVGAARNFWGSGQYFLQAAPDLDFGAIKAEMSCLPGIKTLHGLKVWSLDGFHHVASIHAGVSSNLPSQSRRDLKKSLRQILANHGEFEVTIEWDED